MALDERINIGPTLKCRAKDIFRETTNVSRDIVTLRPEGTADFGGALPPHISLEEHLQSEFAGFASGSH